MINYRRILVLSALISFASSAVLAERAVQILFDKKPVSLSTQEAILSDEVFVPVRHFAESTGATVKYDPASKTLTVTSSRGTGVLKIGSRTGRIRGTRIYFENPPYMYGGQFYGPMIFFNEMFDQAWYWDPFYQQFRWVPIFPRWRGQARPPMFIPGPGRTTPRNSAPRVYPQSNTGQTVRPLPISGSPKIVLRVGDKAATYQVAKDAVVLRGTAESNAVEVPLSSIRPGDRVTFERDGQGTITKIRAQYTQVSGKIRSITGNVITLDTGQTVRLNAQTHIFFPDNSMGMREDLLTGDSLTATIDPGTRDAYVIQVQPRLPVQRPDAGSQDSQIAVNTWGPLSAGDVLVVSFKAGAGGRAWFTVPGAIANSAMTEVSTGAYQGTYVVQPGDTSLRQPIKVTFIAADGTTYTRQSARPVTVRTVGSYLPRILSPRQGQQIKSPLVVSGEAQPGTRIRVVVEFRRLAQGYMPLQGVTAIQDVRTDADGHWQTPPLAAVAPFSDQDPVPPDYFGVFSDIFDFDEDREPPTVYTITAVTVGPNGEEMAAYSVDVTKWQGYTIGGLPSLLVELRADSAG